MSDPKLKVLVTDAIDREGLKALADHPSIELRYEIAPGDDLLEKALQGVGAWLVRSETKVTAPWIRKAQSLKLIGRAGVGVDNIDLEEATRRGIAVVNAPSANTIAACEHALGLMLALSRNIPQADADVKAGRWQRSKWMGAELQGKILGVVGLGRIGREVAKRALGFGMKVLAHDPFVSAGQAEELGIELLGFDALLSRSDYVTLHAPGSDATKHLVGTESLAKMKKGARLINCARGELVDENALAQALRSGHLAGAALDVFQKEPLGPGSPLRSLPQVILTPHLGASTQEAQSKVASELALSVITFFERGIAPNALNLPGFDPDTVKALGEFLGLAETLGRFAGQMIDSGLREVNCAFHGEFKPSERRPLSVAALKGVLSTMLAQGVTYISAPALAAERGIRTSESTDPAGREGFRQLMTVSAITDRGALSVSGAVLAPGEPRIVRLGQLAVEVRPQGKMIVLTNQDRPGMIGRVGVLLGNKGINIADMRVGRKSPKGEAVMVLTVDDEVGPPLRSELASIEGVTNVRWIKL
ncbi:MAG: phosphoglycerate dehydrogenase [Elusimicrobia bacterium]|nr:phosphoglycerate dehydrogenase [Elusimicrobiota bacterium]